MKRVILPALCAMLRSPWLRRVVFVLLLGLCAATLMAQATFAQSAISVRDGNRAWYIDSVGAADLPASGLQVPPVVGNKRWLTLLCKYADIAAEPEAPAYFQTLMSNESGGMDHYWREVSYGQIDVSNSQVAEQWVSLPSPHSTYVQLDADGGTIQTSLLEGDCHNTADQSIDLDDYYGIHYMFNWGWHPDDPTGTSAYGGYMSIGSAINGYTVLPPWGFTTTYVAAHEMGHAFGLRHSASSDGYEYGNLMDVMSGGTLIHPIAFHKDMLGWIPEEKKVVVDAGDSMNVTLEQLALPTNDNPLLIIIPIGDIPIGDNAEHFYTIEARRQVGYDQDVIGNSVIIHEVTTTQEVPARIVTNPEEDAFTGILWTPGEVFTDETHQITVSIVSETATGYVLQVASGGELPARTFAQAVYLPSISGSE